MLNASALSTRFNVDYEINKKQNISLEYAYSENEEKDNTLITKYIIFQDMTKTLFSTGDFPIQFNSSNSNITLNYNWETDEKGSKFSFISDYTYNNGLNASGTNSETFNFQKQLVTDISFVFYSSANAKIFTLKLQYDWKFNKEATLTFGGK